MQVKYIPGWLMLSRHVWVMGWLLFRLSTYSSAQPSLIAQQLRNTIQVGAWTDQLVRAGHLPSAPQAAVCPPCVAVRQHGPASTWQNAAAWAAARDSQIHSWFASPTACQFTAALPAPKGLAAVPAVTEIWALFGAVPSSDPAACSPHKSSTGGPAVCH